MQSVLLSPVMLLFLSVVALYVLQLPGFPPLAKRIVYWCFFALLLFALVLTVVAHEPSVRTYRW